MNIPQELRYTSTHEWAKAEAKDVLVGLTAHAQEELRDVVYVELPAVGKTLKQGEPAAVVESVKAAFDIYAPVSGTIARINTEVSKTPQLVNADCYGKGWLFAITPSNAQDFMTLLAPDAYAKLTQTPAH